MPPLIVHNVPEEERYVGEDGIKRPFAIVYPLSEGAAKLKKNAPETGSFGKSSSRARSRSKTGTPAKREDPTLLAGDALFSNYIQRQAKSPERKPSASNPLTNKEGKANSPGEHHRIQNVPTEVILRGYKSTHQYAAINAYESIAGRICEDYPRDPPLDQRRFKNDIREPAAIRARRLTPEERSKASKFAGGEHWIKVTFESLEAAEKAIESSPQHILGHFVYAEFYRGVPPRNDEAIAEESQRRDIDGFASPIRPRANHPGFASSTPRSRRGFNHSPSDSQTSTNTLETATLSTATVSSATVTAIPDSSPSIFNRPSTRPTNPPSTTTSSQTSTTLQQTEPSTLPPGIKPMKLLPASQALLPRPSALRRVISQLPLGSWLSHDIIGSQVPRTETGEFDWRNASFYWKLVFLLDKWLGFQNGDVAGREEGWEGKDE